MTQSSLANIINLEALSLETLSQHTGSDPSLITNQMSESVSPVMIGFVAFLFGVLCLVLLTMLAFKCPSLKQKLTALKNKVLWNPVIKGF